MKREHYAGAEHLLEGDVGDRDALPKVRRAHQSGSGGGRRRSRVAPIHTTGYGAIEAQALVPNARAISESGRRLLTISAEGRPRPFTRPTCSVQPRKNIQRQVHSLSGSALRECSLQAENIEAAARAGAAPKFLRTEPAWRLDDRHLEKPRPTRSVE